MLLDNLKEYNVVLASQSPRRRELLALMNIPFTVVEPYDVDETCPPNINTDEAAWYLSRLKALHYPYEIAANDLIITSDTLVILDDKMYGKPKDRQEAINTLKSLSGKTHKVITGVTFKTKALTQSFSETTQVTFKSLKEEDIIFYVDHFSPYDKAGSYAIQEWIGAVGVSSINGSYFNIMGLPTETLYGQLTLFLNKLKK